MDKNKPDKMMKIMKITNKTLKRLIKMKRRKTLTQIISRHLNKLNLPNIIYTSLVRDKLIQQWIWARGVLLKLERTVRLIICRFRIDLQNKKKCTRTTNLQTHKWMTVVQLPLPCLLHLSPNMCLKKTKIIRLSFRLSISNKGKAVLIRR